jgi:hypothetical protein
MLIYVAYKIATLPIRDLPPATGDVIQSGGKVRQMRVHQNHPTVLVFIAVRYGKSFDRMVPKHTPLGSLWNSQARDFGAVFACGRKGICARRGG